MRRRRGDLHRVSVGYEAVASGFECGAVRVRVSPTPSTQSTCVIIVSPFYPLRGVGHERRWEEDIRNRGLFVSSP